LYRQNKQNQNFEVSTYIDLFIFQSASKLNKKLISLESFGMSEIKARLAAMPDSDASTNNRNAFGNFSSYEKIEDAYREGNLDLLDSLSKKTSSRNNQKYLLEDRNVFFVNTMDSVMQKSTIFAGVGSAHLPGQRGVIELLRKKGYTVESVMPTVSKKSHAKRENLDAMIHPVQIQKQFTADSSFSLMMPGKLYSLVNLENLKYEIYADMVNGTFYNVARLNYFGPLCNISSKQMLAKIDSIIFESIPGKIIKKLDIMSNNGLKGFDILNQTRSGDMQRYQILVSDMEIFLFKIGGKAKYAEGNEAKQFFNSINFRSVSEQKINFTPPTSGFSISIPANYVYTKNDASSLQGLVEDGFCYNTSSQTYYGLKQVVYNDFNYLEQDTFELYHLAKNTLSNYQFTLSPKFNLTQTQAHPSIEFNASNSTGKIFSGKIILKGVHYYLLFTISSDANKSKDFISSFYLQNFKYINTIKEITDKDFCFKTYDEVSENALSHFNESLAKAYEQALPKPTKNKSDFDYRSASKFYYSPSSNEYVSLLFEKYNDYDYRDSTSIAKKVEEVLSKSSTMQVRRKKSEFEKGIFKYECLLTDTACSRGIAIKLFFKDGISLELTAPFDTLVGMHGWEKSFYNNLKLMDTTVGKNIFKNKFDDLAKALVSADTAVKQAATTSIKNSVGVHKNQLNNFVKFLNEAKLQNVNEDVRAQLFVNGGTLNSDKIIEPYKKIYTQYTDSFYLQLCLLKGLGLIKTQNAFNAILELLLQETPMLGNSNTVKDVFSVLHDSLQLCKNYFPRILTLAQLDDYKEAVYSLLSDLVNQNIISEKIYATNKLQILNDALLNLKRYNPAATKLEGQDANTFERLDKVDRELAENLKLQIDAYDNYVQNKKVKQPKRYDYWRRPSIIDFAIALAPFYKDDEKVKQYFNKLSKIKSQNIAFPLILSLYKQGQSLNDSLFTQYCNNNLTQSFVYCELEKENLIQKNKNKNFNQKSFVHSLLCSQMQLAIYYSNLPNKVKLDSLKFIDKIKVENNYQKGDLYIYKAPKEISETELWTIAFVPQGIQGIGTTINLVSSNYFPSINKSKAENVLELKNKFNDMYRKRSGNVFENNQQYND
jgi:hypothetical protein